MLQSNKSPAATGEWECMECGCIVEGVKAQRPQGCPDGGAPGQALEFFPFGDDDEADWGEQAVEHEASAKYLFDDEDEDMH